MRMHKLKALLSLSKPFRRNDSSFFLSNHYCRQFSAQPSYAQVDYLQEQVLVEGRAKSRAAILNRPSALNALTLSMAGRLNRLYESWEENSDIGFVMMKSNGRAFCSGADVVTLYELIKEGKVEECKKFFQTLYKFVYLLGTYLKPNVAILDGVTMGSGAGISLPGMFRVVTNRTILLSDVLIKGSDASAAISLEGLDDIRYLASYAQKSSLSLFTFSIS